MKIEINEIYNTDCIVGMSYMKDKSIDMILCDLPYGTTQCKWDSIIPPEELWKQFERIIKDNGAMVFTATQPFTTILIESNKKHFKYCWYWIKNQVTGFPFAKYQPLRCVEDILVFYKKMPVYNPQGLILLDKPIKSIRNVKGDNVYKSGTLNKSYESRYTNYPRQTLNFKCQREGLHPTQKPVELFEYLIRTYTNENEIVLDCCMGSGTTAIAALKSGRKFIGFKLDREIFEIADKRIREYKLLRKEVFKNDL